VVILVITTAGFFCALVKRRAVGSAKASRCR
jgi:hypothetical protein